ncbi:MAG: hypothetical protein KUG81_06265 [Gammaproteobacteria bacterium]|nr:hypothetical protein [Gammaproteobacteria bacterium]
MKNSKIIIATILLAATSISHAYASEGYPKSPKYKRLEDSSTYMSGKGVQVANPKIRPCKSVVDCRHKGQNLNSINQFNRTKASTKSTYPKSHKDKRRESRMAY